MNRTTNRPPAPGRSCRKTFAFCVGLLFTMTALTHGAPADLDPSFGNGGTVIKTVANSDRVYAAALQPDGKIVLAGSSRTSTSGSYPNYALTRFHPNGTLDGSFGVGGVVTTNLGIPTGAAQEIHALVLQPDGKIVAVGSVKTTGGGYVATGVVRYQSNGSLDPSFGVNGILAIDAAADAAAVLQPDGKIVCGGGEGVSSMADFQIARVHANGTLDSTFGTNGIATIDFTGDGDGIFGLALQPDGKIVAVGRTSNIPFDGTRWNFAAARVLPNGALDATFGAGGKVWTDFAAKDDTAFAVLIQGDGKILLAGRGQPQENDWDFALVRYHANGTLDTSFGLGGKTITPLSNIDGAFAVKLQTDGKIVTAGVRGGTSTAFALMRHNPDGSLDSTFGDGGKVVTFFNGRDEARAVLIQPDGRIIVAGTSRGGASIGDFAMARYLGDLQLNGAFSRGAHGSQTFDLDLPIVGAVGVEGRNINGSLALVFTFNAPITGGSASVQAGAASISGNVAFAGNSMRVELTNVADAQTLTLNLSGVNDAFGRAIPSLPMTMQILLGDVTGNGVVNASDVGLVKNESGAAVTLGNFRADVSMNGVINATDIALVKSHSGARTPAAASRTER